MQNLRRTDDISHLDDSGAEGRATAAELHARSAKVLVAASRHAAGDASGCEGVAEIIEAINALLKVPASDVDRIYVLSTQFAGLFNRACTANGIDPVRLLEKWVENPTVR